MCKFVDPYNTVNILFIYARHSLSLYLYLHIFIICSACILYTSFFWGLISCHEMIPDALSLVAICSQASQWGLVYYSYIYPPSCVDKSQPVQIEWLQPLIRTFAGIE